MPLRVESTALASCRAEHVWRAFSDTATWPIWNPVIGSAYFIQGQPWQPGSTLKLQIVHPISFTLQPSVRACEPPGWVHLGGGGMGAVGDLAFSFEPQADGATLLRARSEFSGPAMFFVSERMIGDVKRVFDEWLYSLRNEAERIAIAQAVAVQATAQHELTAQTDPVTVQAEPVAAQEFSEKAELAEQADINRVQAEAEPVGEGSDGSEPKSQL